MRAHTHTHLYTTAIVTTHTFSERTKVGVALFSTSDDKRKWISFIVFFFAQFSSVVVICVVYFHSCFFFCREKQKLFQLRKQRQRESLRAKNCAKFKNVKCVTQLTIFEAVIQLCVWTEKQRQIIYNLCGKTKATLTKATFESTWTKTKKNPKTSSKLISRSRSSDFEAAANAKKNRKNPVKYSASQPNQQRTPTIS